LFVGEARTACEVVLKGKERRPIHVQIEATLAADGRSCHAAVIDITDRRQMEALSAARQEAEQARLEQVFWNLFKNAIKFTPSGGTVTIRSTNPGPGRLSVQVSDTGVGIEPDKLAAIFSPFEQGGIDTTRLFGGLGLGLAIAKAVTDAHGGTIQAQSVGPGKGTILTVTLPAAEPQPQAALRSGPGAAARGEGPGNGSARILLVEDHETTSQVLQRFIRKWGWEVTPVSSIGLALDTADRQPFDLVISDLGLPDGSGHDLMRQLHGARGLKGIALSGYGMESDIQKSLAAGFVVHLVKPLDFNELRSAISAVMAGTSRSRNRRDDLAPRPAVPPAT
jgi:CheY-like chemotaxis protein